MDFRSSRISIPVILLLLSFGCSQESDPLVVSIQGEQISVSGGAEIEAGLVVLASVLINDCRELSTRASLR
jgi:hypothetical protein